ncbi:MAG: prephenate dehydratase [Saprospiraceae bacterium]|jgi:prephenate dehydratase
MTQEIISEKETATALSVAIQGYPGAFHEIASRLYFSEEENLDIVPAHTFDDLVRMVDNNETDTALMAIENSLEGSLMYNYRLLYNGSFSIVGEIYLRIKQNLMTLPGKKIEDLTEVRSHPMAIAQCREFFRQYPRIRLVETVDTALSAKQIEDENLQTVGAIASTLAAKLYNLEIIAPSIETNKLNYTRFLVLRRNEDLEMVSNINKISVSFAVSHDVGSLQKVLTIMAAYNMNLTKIQSTPIAGKQWEYRFFIDFMLGEHLDWQQSVDALKPLTADFKVLGAYQKGEHFEY